MIDGLRVPGKHLPFLKNRNCFVLIILSGCVFFLNACVPSATATPPRETPFPTLPISGETATPSEISTGAPVATTLPPQTGEPTFAPPIETLPASAAQVTDSLAPVVQATVQDPELPVSLGQTVGVNVSAADDNLIARLVLYDNDLFYAQATAIVPASVYSNQFTWKAATIGKHTLRAVAYDASGNASEPAQIVLTVINDNRAPEVQITSLSESKDLELGAPLLIQGVATDDVAVTRVDLIVDNQLVTFVTSDKPEGVTPFAVAIPWTPTATGTHNIVLRAYDNQAQSDDSLRSIVRVFDNQPPVVTAQNERDKIPPGDALVVQVIALSNNGISRVDLYVDDILTGTAPSNSPLQQTALHANLAAANLPVGAHTWYVRAFDTTGESSDSPRGVVLVEPDAPRIYHAMPAAPSTGTPAPLPPTPTAVLAMPAPPTIQIALADDSSNVLLPSAAQLTLTAHGSVELGTIEVWARYPGEQAQVLAEESGKGATDKTFTLSWNPPHAGVVEVSARVFDNLGQAAMTAPLEIQIQPPPAPTPSPDIFNFAQIWIAESSAARFEVTFVQIGRALRGVFVEKNSDGSVLTGNVVSGAVTEKSASFGVDFVGSTDGAEHTLVFDCSFIPRPPQLTCNYANEKQERGSAIFAPLEQ